MDELKTENLNALLLGYNSVIHRNATAELAALKERIAMDKNEISGLNEQIRIRDGRIAELEQQLRDAEERGYNFACSLFDCTKCKEYNEEDEGCDIGYKNCPISLFYNTYAEARAVQEQEDKIK